MATRFGTTLFLSAANRAHEEVPCSFVVRADGVVLARTDVHTFQLRQGTREVTIEATPETRAYWPTTVELMLAPDGTYMIKPGTSAMATVLGLTGGSMAFAHVAVRVSSFREVTSRVVELLQKVPLPRVGRAPPTAELKGTYGDWPPADWGIHPVKTAHFLDVNDPVKPGGILNFARQPSLDPEVDSVVLELAGVKAPRLFGVTWPKAIAPIPDAVPTPILLFVRQTGGQDAVNGVFVGGGVSGKPYPYNFDYAERCLFESLHYPPTPLFKSIGWTLRPKGVPYQVAASGAKAVSVFPVADGRDGIGFGILADMEQTGKALEELQAFMFWRAGVAVPPASVGKTAIATYSSANYKLAEWLNADLNLSSAFLNDTVRAVYLLDPPNVGISVAAAMAWDARAGDRGIRLYSRSAIPAIHRKLLNTKAPSGAYVSNSGDGLRTVASLPESSWVKTFKDVFDKSVDVEWWDAHHFIPATVLTHALQQGDLL